MQWILDNWEFLAFVSGLIFAGLVWAIRLEGKQTSLKDQIKLMNNSSLIMQREIDHVKTKQESIDSKIAGELKAIQIELAQLRGFLMQNNKKYGK